MSHPLAGKIILNDIDGILTIDGITFTYETMMTYVTTMPKNRWVRWDRVKYPDGRNVMIFGETLYLLFDPPTDENHTRH